jgi:hypothetical protein
MGFDMRDLIKRGGFTRLLLLAALLGMSLAIPGFAQQSRTLSFTLSNPSTTSTSTSFNATIGGVKGTVTTTAGGNWTMTVAGQTFASGTYTCGGGSCSFTGSTLSGKSLSFSMTNTSGTLAGRTASLADRNGPWT